MSFKHSSVFSYLLEGHLKQSTGHFQDDNTFTAYLEPAFIQTRDKCSRNPFANFAYYYKIPRNCWMTYWNFNSSPALFLWLSIFLRLFFCFAVLSWRLKFYSELVGKYYLNAIIWIEMIVNKFERYVVLEVLKGTWITWVVSMVSPKAA